ncbi:MAG TPA: ABC transporter ATP-binding protein [Trueperaceae bacterium]
MSHHPLRRLWRLASAHRPRILLATAFSVLNKLFDLAPPLLIGVAVDIVVNRNDSFLARLGVVQVMSQLWLLAAATVLIWALESLTDYISELQWRNLAQQVQHDLRLAAYDRMQGLELAYFEDRSTGGLMAILNDDVNQLERFLDVGANDLLQLATTVVVIGAFFFTAAPSVAWLSFLPIPLIVWGALRFQRLMEPRYARVREQVGILNSQLGNNISGMQTIKSFTAEERESERIRQASDEYRERNRLAIRFSAAFVPLIRMAIAAGFVATLVYGGALTVDGALNVGVYSTMVFMTQRLLWPLTRLGQTFDLYQRAMASTRRILGLLDTQRSMVPGRVPLPRESVEGGYRFEGVSFAYPGSGSVLRRLDLAIPARSTAAIVGATGAGKSTLIKLLLRFYDPVEGRVTLDGHDLRELDLFDLRDAVGLVSQDVFLFHGTVRDNIAYGRPDASFEEIVRAAGVAEAHAFVERLPLGYDTIVGERGQKLSGGQRQRISIARALLKDPPILILDEATSAVDNETEAAIQRSLERLAVGRTVIVIAHRLSTVRHSDVIHVLDEGRLVESGSHEELLRREGLYAGLWRVQTGERSRERIAGDD